jgi:uncharacterized protein (TIGR00255 family)
MIKSMTGYGKGRAVVEGMSLTVEIKSVNHRYSDLNMKSPRSLFPMENEIKKRVGERLKRGKIDIFINQEMVDGAVAAPVLNGPLAAAYVEVFRELREAFGLEEVIPVSLVASQKDVIVVREAEPDEEKTRQCIDEALGRSLEAIEGMRLAEGEATRRDIEGRLDAAAGLLDRIEQRAPQVPLEWRIRLAERLERLGGDFSQDPQRVAQEVAIYADRCDISEELARFKSHLDQFRKLLDQNEPVGRQLDFLVQELNRETNTMGSKSNDAELTRQVVALKAELEKIREQVQNIE